MPRETVATRFGTSRRFWFFGGPVALLHFTKARHGQLRALLLLLLLLLCLLWVLSNVAIEHGLVAHHWAAHHGAHTSRVVLGVMALKGKSADVVLMMVH